VTARTRRTRLLVDWRLQLRFLGFNLLYFGACILTLAAIAFSGPAAVLLSGAASAEERRDASAEFLALHTRLWPAVVVILALFTVHSLFVSHRVAGPLYRFRRAYQQIGAGNLSLQVVTRRRDHLPLDAAALNEMAAALNQRLSRVKEQAAKLDAALDELRGALDGQAADATRGAANSAIAEAGRLRELLEEFRTVGGEFGAVAEAVTGEDA
jgi:methyl-accepting chemotaxis protein